MTDLLGRLPASAGSGQVVVSVTEDPIDAPDREPDVATPTAQVWSSADRLFARIGSVTTVASPTEIAVPGDGGPEVRALLPLLLGFTLAHHGRYVLHATVLDHDEVSLVALARSGGGKSTLALAASRSGWQVRTDDTAVVHAPKDGPVVVGLPRTAWVPHDLLEESPDRRADRRGRVALSLAEPGPGRPLGAVASVSWSASATGSLAPATASDLLPLLLEAFNASHVPHLAKQWFPIAGRLSRRPVFEIALSNDPRSRLDETTKALDQLLATFRSDTSSVIR